MNSERQKSETRALNLLRNIIGKTLPTNGSKPYRLMNKKLLNWVFIAQLILFGLIVTGVLPRAIVPYLAIALAVYVLLPSLEDATVFFVRSIPFFLAIPITATRSEERR